MTDTRGGAALFENRADVGRQLAGLLTSYHDKDTLVLALPRGGVPVAFEVAQALSAPLDVIVARKLGSRPPRVRHRRHRPRCTFP